MEQDEEKRRTAKTLPSRLREILPQLGWDEMKRREETPPLKCFLPDEGINYEVIQNDICRYLGNDATVQPGQHPDVGSHPPNGLKHHYSG
jgi:hypothetical protein